MFVFDASLLRRRIININEQIARNPDNFVVACCPAGVHAQAVEWRILVRRFDYRDKG